MRKKSAVRISKPKQKGGYLPKEKAIVRFCAALSKAAAKEDQSLAVVHGICKECRVATQLYAYALEAARLVADGLNVSPDCTDITSIHDAAINDAMAILHRDAFIVALSALAYHRFGNDRNPPTSGRSEARETESEPAGRP